MRRQPTIARPWQSTRGCRRVRSVLNNGALACSGPVRDQRRPPGLGTRHAVAGKGRQPEPHGFRGLGKRIAADVAGGYPGPGRKQAQSPRVANVRAGSAPCISSPRSEESRRPSPSCPGTRRPPQGPQLSGRFNVLAPKNLEGNFSALAVYSFLRDREALERLSQKVAADKPDSPEINAERTQALSVPGCRTTARRN